VQEVRFPIIQLMMNLLSASTPRKNGLPSAFWVFCQIVLFLAADETKHFVNLDKREIDLAHHLVEQEGGFAARHFQHRLNGVRMRFGNPCRGADAHAFNQEIYDSRRLFERRFEPAQWPV
jgi:hypothetical protein